jgi:hypothetical protein
MSFFKKKSSSDEIPEIPPVPQLPSINSASTKPPIDLPATAGDARDASNQEAIKSAIDSSEKIGGDSGAANSPSENFTIPPMSSPQVQPIPQKSSMLPSLPTIPQQNPLPEVPKYAPKPVTSTTLPEPPVRPTPMANPFVQQSEPAPQMLPQEEKTVKKDASESIFVRIDKFNSAKRDVEEIERDLKQITQVIDKITDIKLKEDEEITEINKTLEEIKNRINRIELDVFNRI